MTDTQALISTATEELRHAANLAEAQWDSPFAAQIRLAAAALPTPAPPHAPAPTDAPCEGTLTGHLTRALECLDAIAPLDGPPDLQLCAWHIHELRRIAAEGIPS